MRGELTLWGYTQDILMDEIQAYLLDRRCIGRSGISGKSFERAGKEIKRIFRRYSDELKRV